MATLKRKSSGGTWTTVAMPQDFPVSLPITGVKYATGTVTVNNGDAYIPFDFDPDIVVLEANAYSDGELSIYSNIVLPLYRISNPDTQKAEGIGWGGDVWPSLSDNDFALGVLASKATNAVSLYFYTITYDMDYYRLNSGTFTWKAYKFMGGATS